MSIEESYFHNRAICHFRACVRERERMAGETDPEMKERLVVHRYEGEATCGPDDDEPPLAG